MGETKRKRGRPLKEGARRYPEKTYFNEEEEISIVEVSEMTGESKSELLRQAWVMYNNYRRFQLRPVEDDEF